MKRYFAMFAVAALVAGGISTSQAASCTGRVYAATLSFSGAAQDTDNGNPTIEKIKATTGNIVALALGQNPEAPVPANLMLAWVSYCDCDRAGRLIIWNSNTQSEQLTIASLAAGPYTEASIAGLAVQLLDFEDVGGINGGYMALSLKFGVGSDGCLAKASAALTGLLNVSFTDDDGFPVVGMDVLMLKGKLAVKGPPIGVVVD